MLEPATRRQRVRRLVGIGITILVAAFLTLLLLAVDVGQREAARRNQCLSQMRQLVLAVHYYHDAHGELPPPYLNDAIGKPTLSWRVLLLPFMDEKELYDRFNLERPWNDPVNFSLEISDGSIFHCPSSHESKKFSDYFAVVGPGTLWPGSEALKMSQVTDGLSNTIAFIEVQGRKVHWSEPRELTLDEALAILTSSSHTDNGHRVKPSFLHQEIMSRNIALADGRAVSLNSPLDRKLAAALLTANGGDEIDDAVQKIREAAGNVPLDWPAIYALSAFAALSLLPLARVFRATS